MIPGNRFQCPDKFCYNLHVFSLFLRACIFAPRPQTFPKFKTCHIISSFSVPPILPSPPSAGNTAPPHHLPPHLPFPLSISSTPTILPPTHFVPGATSCTVASPKLQIPKYPSPKHISSPSLPHLTVPVGTGVVVTTVIVVVTRVKCIDCVTVCVNVDSAVHVVDSSSDFVVELVCPMPCVWTVRGSFWMKTGGWFLGGMLAQ